MISQDETSSRATDGGDDCKHLPVRMRGGQPGLRVIQRRIQIFPSDDKCMARSDERKLAITASGGR